MSDLWTTLFSEMKNILLPIPPREEQDKIVTFLDEQINKVESEIINKQKQIEKLQDLKTRLISDTVTGKIDVRGIEIPDYEYVEEEMDELLKNEEKLEDRKEEK